MSAAFLQGAFLCGSVVYRLVHPQPGDSVVPRTLRAVTTAVNREGTAIGVAEADDPTSFIAGYDVSNSDGRECLVPLSYGQPVELGIVRVASVGPHSGYEDTVLWIRCLGSPTHVRP